MDQLLTIYKASAGSGKTFALATEYIAGLLQPKAEKEFLHTLAVTFTNKATAEMKDRILEALYGLKHNLRETQGYMDVLLARAAETGMPLTPSLVSERAGKALNAILHDYSHFRVETIDSFFQSVLRNMARELGLAANLQVELGHEEVVRCAVDSLIETMDAKPEVKRWVLDCVREQLESGDKWDIVGPLKVFAANIFKEAYQRRSKEELERIGDAEAVKAFKSQMHAIRNRAQKEVEEAVSEVMRLIPGFDSIAYGKNLRKFLTEASAMKSEGPTKTIETIRLKTTSKSHLKGENSLPLREGWGGSEALQEAYARLLALYPSRRKEYLSATLALRHLGPLRLLEYIDERAREIEGDAGRFTLSSTPALLSKMIEGSDAPFIFEKIGTFINNVMIDEFQDTSRMQWENFKKLLFEKLASGGKGLLVGDIKQSIYRWRGGDWKILFGIEKEKELQRFHLQPKLLDTNYRSHGLIIDFNNSFFPKAAKILDGIKPEAEIKLSEIYADVEQKKRKDDGKGYVRITLFKETDDYVQATITDMAEQIRRLLQKGIDLSEIAILVRTNLMARQLVEGFSRYAPDIRLVSDEAFLLEASTSVQMIVAAMRLLIAGNRTDKISENYLMLRYLRDVLKKEETTIQSIAIQEAAQILPEEFTSHREELLGLPLYILAVRLWRIFSLAGIQGEDAYVLTFFDELQNYLHGGGTPDIQSFLSEWDEKLRTKAISGSSVAGIRIITIHKSKGLEFHTVLQPFCHWDIEKDRQGDILWCETDMAPYNELGALPISIHSKDVRASVFAPNYEEEHLERRADALNTLYVAFTRAECNLYVWGKTKPLDKIKDITTAGELIYTTLCSDNDDTDEEIFTYETGTPLTEKKKEKDERERNRLRIEHRMADAVDVKVATRNPALHFQQSNQAQDYLEQMKREELSTKDESNASPFTLSQRELGKRMHEVLSRIDDASQFDDVLREAQQEGIIGEGEEWDNIIRHVAEGFRNPLVASWFQPKNIIYNECSIASKDERSGLPCVLRPDRVVMGDNCITVIDYKFGHASSLHHEQVKTYMMLLLQMYPEHEVQGYIWYIMDGETRRVAPPSNSPKGENNNK